MNVSLCEHKFLNMSTSINFKSSKREMINEDGIKISGNYTNMFRKDIEWDNLTDLIIEKKCKHIYSLACSDGSEAYTIAIKLIERLGEDKANKYRPIQAIDTDEYIINLANSGYINLTESDVKRINQATRNNFEKYFEDIDVEVNKNGFKTYKVNNFLRDFVKFEKIDVLDFTQKTLPPDSLLLLRNFWGYLPIDKQKELVKNLNMNTNKNTYIVLGILELMRTKVVDYLKNIGYKPVDKKITLNDPPQQINRFIGASVMNTEIKNGVLCR